MRTEDGGAIATLLAAAFVALGAGTIAFTIVGWTVASVASAGAGVLLGCAALLVGHTALRRQVAARRNAEEALARGREDLEARVLERTAALAHGEARLRSTLDAMLEGCQIIAPDWRYLYVNEAAAAHGRQPRDELVGRTMMERYPGIEDSELFGIMRDCMERRVARRMENEFPFPDGSTGTFELSIQPVPEGLFILSMDVSERHRHEEAMLRLNAELERHVAERTAQLAAANVELEAFSYSVSHDLRAPLRSIDGFSQALLEDCGPALDATGKGYLRRVRGAAQHMAQLIDDLLGLARVTRAEMSFAPVDLSALAAEVVGELREGEPGRAVEVSISPGLRANGDARLCRVLLFNLLGNAWKFSADRRPARIELGDAEHGENGMVACYVRDNGAGFDMAYADKLFAPFQRLHSREEYPGTGIGLATVQRIVGRHGGRVWAEGEVGRGATFGFTLPAAGAQEREPPAGREDGAQ
jgi:PAS domain S-box-containing protein